MVQVDTWVAASGKNGMRRDWLIRDCRTGEILTRASRLKSLSNYSNIVMFGFQLLVTIGVFVYMLQ